MVRVENGSSKVVNTSSGSFVFSRPGIHLDLPKPYEQVIQADGEKLFIYDKDLNQVTTKKLGNALGSSPAAILSAAMTWKKLHLEGSRHQGWPGMAASRTQESKDTTFDNIGIGLKNGTPWLWNCMIPLARSLC
jgi:outer membrane lipoprotein carrier protein